eukprot:5257878-Amphidinium_carterae.1
MRSKKCCQEHSGAVVKTHARKILPRLRWRQGRSRCQAPKTLRHITFLECCQIEGPTTIDLQHIMMGLFEWGSFRPLTKPVGGRVGACL